MLRDVRTPLRYVVFCTLLRVAFSYIVLPVCTRARLRTTGAPTWFARARYRRCFRLRFASFFRFEQVVLRGTARASLRHGLRSYAYARMILFRT